MKGVTQMEFTAPVRVYLASFLVGPETASHQATPQKHSSRQPGWLEGSHSPEDPGVSQQLEMWQAQTCCTQSDYVADSFKYVLSQYR